jgi:formylglycine-generating enzyme required for sulfatase activity
VGSYAPNKLGLYDMHGNVWQWCDDNASSRPGGKMTLRLVKGGSWFDSGKRCQAADSRKTSGSMHTAIIGFRLVRIASVDQEK